MIFLQKNLTLPDHVIDPECPFVVSVLFLRIDLFYLFELEVVGQIAEIYEEG